MCNETEPRALPEDSDSPKWFDGKKVIEIAFCEEFLTRHPMCCIHGRFFTADGPIPDDVVRRLIYEELKAHAVSGVGKAVATLLDVLRMECYSPGLPLQTDRIHVANGTLFLDGRLEPAKEFCLNRLPVEYHPDAPAPKAWLRFLEELLYDEDIPTLQEYMGYCLLPTTKAQRMLFLIGRGGEGKSRIGPVMRALFGTAMNTGSLSKVETSPFARADLENKLVMVDDDIKLEALPQTHIIKAIVTAELPMDLERKGKQSYQGNMFVRFMAFGNGVMKAANDRSEGFFRRQLILSVRERPDNRVDDPYLAEALCAEAEGILLWCLEGLRRLLANRYRFTVSARTQANRESAVRDSNNVVEFMASTGYIRRRADAEITSRVLYAIYRLWCTDNAYQPLSAKSFSNYLSQHERVYSLSHTNTVRNAAGKRVWGFTGIEGLVTPPD